MGTKTLRGLSKSYLLLSNLPFCSWMFLRSNVFEKLEFKLDMESRKKNLKRIPNWKQLPCSRFFLKLKMFSTSLFSGNGGNHRFHHHQHHQVHHQYPSKNASEFSSLGPSSTHVLHFHSDHETSSSRIHQLRKSKLQIKRH